VVVDRFILASILVISIIIAWRFIPKEKARDAFILYLVIQFITWPTGLLVVEMKWIEYPIQLLPDDNHDYKSSIYFEFFLFPLTAILFNFHYPETKKLLFQVLYYLVIAGFFTAIEFMLERYTKLVEYHQWQWYWSYSSVIFVLFLSHTYYQWFKKGLG